MNVVKIGPNSEQYFYWLSAQSLAQNFVHPVVTAVGEIIGESSRVLLRLLTSDKPDNYATVAAVTRPLNFDKISKLSRVG